MDILLILSLVFVSLLFSVYKGINIVYPLCFGLLLFVIFYMRKGYSLKELLHMILKGSKQSLIIIRIFILIGAITAIWRASGTVPFIVYYGIKLMNPDYFILSAFILSCIVSFLLGTSFGTVGTIGIVLMVMAQSGNVNINILAGAVIAGAYFGDRCSPMSSSANLVAAITETKLFKNVKNMFITSVAPFILTIIIYSVISFANPLHVVNNSIGNEIVKLYNINIIVLIPALIIFVLVLFKVNVRLSMLLSILSGIVIAMLYQHESIIHILKYIVVGYSSKADSFFANIINGGGLLSMLKVALIVIISSAYSGIFERANTLREIEVYIEKIKNKFGLFMATIIVSIGTASFGCTQALSIMLTNQLQKNLYKKSGKSNYELALDIEDTSVVLSPLVPWNIAGAVPAATLMAGIGFIPYACFLYIFPITSYLAKKLKLQLIRD